MIYETILNSVDDQIARWTGVRDASQQLANALAPVNPAQQLIVNGWQVIAQGQVVALTGGRPALEGFPPLAALLPAAQALFAPSNAALNGPVGINVTATGLLPTLVSSTVPQIASGAGDLQSRLVNLEPLLDSCLQEIIELQSNEGTRANIGGIRSSVDDISTYPVLTQDFSFGPMTPSGGGGSNGSGGSLTQLANKAISAVLGRRPRLVDPKSFLAALNSSFICKDVEGHSECVWTDRAIGNVSEMGGAVTGAQASIYKRAKEAADASVPLLEAIKFLRVDADPQETDAVRAIVENEFSELVNEFGVEGGPRVARVDDLFELLIGYVPGTPITVPPFPPTARGDFEVTIPGRTGLVSANPDLLEAFGGGEVGRLGDVFGFTRNLVNNIEEEQNLTNYLVLRDYVRSLYTSWQEFRGSFLGGVDNYLGTQLILLQRVLGVVSESVDEVTFAMDSVFLGPSERRTVRIDLPNAVSPGPMYVHELLEWVRSYANVEGARMVEDGGKIGVRSIVPTLQLLQRLVQNSEGRIRHPGARHPRVRRTLNELAGQLSEAARLAGTVQ